MANLGSENTPIEGESFGLPSGFSIDEENGDLVIRDTDGTVAMRRADGTWELESDLALNENDISGVGAFDSESVEAEVVKSDSVRRNERSFSFSSEVAEIPLPDVDHVVIQIYQLQSSGNTNSLDLQFSTDGGSSFVTAADGYDWALAAGKSDGTNLDNNNAEDDKIRIIPSNGISGGGSNINCPINISISNPQDNNRVYLSWEGAINIAPGGFVQGGGRTDSSLEANHLRLFEGDVVGLDTIAGRVIINPGGAL